MNTALVKSFEDGTKKAVKIGDWVEFKSDYEQTGQITNINRNAFTGAIVLTLENSRGFGGDYLRYATTTTEFADDCWV